MIWCGIRNGEEEKKEPQELNYKQKLNSPSLGNRPWFCDQKGWNELGTERRNLKLAHDITSVAPWWNMRGGQKGILAG